MDPHNDLRMLLGKLGIMMSNDDFKKFLQEEGKKLQFSRTVRKLEMETVARHIEIPLKVLHDIERGECNWAGDLIARLQSYYDSISVPKEQTPLMESNITYTVALREKLGHVVETSREFAKEDPNKSIEQFLAELNFIISLLKEIRYDVCSYT